MSTSAPSVTSQTRWRAPAEARCIARVIPSAATRISVALMRSNTSGRFQPAPATVSREERFIVLSPVLTRLADRSAQSLDLAVGHVDVGHAEECRHGLLRRSGEVGLNDVGEHILTRDLGGLRRIVHVARSV